MVLAIVGVGGYYGFKAYVYLTGERVQAHVDRCEQKTVYDRHGAHLETTCYGTWTTADGKRHAGKVPDAGVADKGHDVPVRVKYGTVVDGSSGMLWLIVLCAVAVIIGVAIGVAQNRARARARRFQGFGPAGSLAQNFGAPGQPQSGYPSQGYSAPGQPSPGYLQPGQSTGRAIPPGR